ncbi:hypothetical protein KAH43_03005 [Candidatus Bipolaricaulota bacterium]|nr:hypothetical protein [Candidatus Bipolaricaulota bacterium]
MNRQTRRIGWLCTALLIGLSLAGVAQVTHDENVREQVPVVKLLLIDGTKTFASTARVGALAGAIRSTGLVDFTVRFSDEMCLFNDPLACEADLPTTPYDVVVIIPRGIDDASADIIWIVTNISPWTHSESWLAIVVVQGMIDQIFAGLATAVDPSIDLWPAFAASLYQTQGWLR